MRRFCLTMLPRNPCEQHMAHCCNTECEDLCVCMHEVRRNCNALIESKIGQGHKEPCSQIATIFRIEYESVLTIADSTYVLQV